MVRFSVDFLGCKVSYVDLHGIRERLLVDGHEEAAAGGQAELAVINTCCVTNEAVAKSRKAAARAARTHRRVYVTGCAANLAGDEFANLPTNVTVVAKRAEETAAFVAGDVGAIGCVQSDTRLDRVRAFVKIQDGCSFSCNFCVIPLVRGASRSRRADAVLAEVRRRVDQGHREIVLTGINLGCFRDRDAGYDLPRLVREVGATPGLARLRLSSIEINHVNQDLVAALRETATVAKHLHVPLQSGDDGVLRAMRRRYTTQMYLRRLEPLAGEFNLTSDVIVGFPAEDEAAFERTLAMVERARLTKVHVFPYSPRPGTATAGDDPVRPLVKKERSVRLRVLARELERSRWHAKLGGEDVVLVDRRAVVMATTTRRSWSMPRSASSSACKRARSRRRESLASQREDCLFCGIVRNGTYVAQAKGFVAINDINPQASVHLLVIPERHVDTFREVGEFPAREAKRMLEFVAETAREVGLSDYRVQVNVGASAGQTVFHLHWHVLGTVEQSQESPALATAVTEL